MRSRTECADNRGLSPIYYGVRRWTVVDGAKVVGTATLAVRAGVGTLSLDPGGEDQLAAVRRSLAADAQVRELVVQ
jgi:hypothetical protein